VLGLESEWEIVITRVRIRVTLTTLSPLLMHRHSPQGRFLHAPGHPTRGSGRY
jgi:hypothetical protein